jgi:hypothetical protein
MLTGSSIRATEEDSAHAGDTHEASCLRSGLNRAVGCLSFFDIYWRNILI